MNPFTQKIQEAISTKLDQTEFELSCIIPIPNRSDHITLKNTINDAIEDTLLSSTSETYHFVLQIKSKKNDIIISENSLESINDFSAAPYESVFQENGKLNIPYLLKNADLLFDSCEYLLASNIYKRIHKDGNRSSLTLYKLGRCFEQSNQLEEACASYEESIAYQSHIETYQRLSAILIRQKKDLLAAKVLERAFHLKEINNEIKFELCKAAGNCWNRGNEHENAERNYLQALKLKPNADDVRSNLGVLYLQMNRIQDAKRNFQDAIASNPDNHQAISGLGTYYFAEGDKKTAYQFFVQSLEIELNNPSAIFYLVKCAYEIKSYSTAEKILKKYIQIVPVHANLLYSLAGLQFHLGNIDEALKAVQTVLRIQPHHIGASELLSTIQGMDASESKPLAPQKLELESLSRRNHGDKRNFTYG